MPYYFLDLYGPHVTAELTDASQAQDLIANVGPRYAVLETQTVLTAKAIAVPSGPAPVAVIDPIPQYMPLDVLEVAYTPFVVADVFTDYDVPPAEVHHDTSLYELVTDAGGFVRSVSEIITTPPPKDVLRVTTDATDDNPPDGYPDIPADAVATCRIMIQKVSGSTGNNLSGPQDSELVQIRTESGRLSAVQVNLVNGYAEVILTSSTDTVITTIRVLDPTGALNEGTLQIQFA